MNTCTKAELARRLGCSRSYVRKLELAGRLVLVDGHVDLDGSLELIRQTAAPGRSGIRELDSESDPDYQHWRTRREAALATAAELDYRLAAGELVAVEVVDQIFTDRGALLRSRIDQIPERVAWAAAAGTLAADLAVECERILADLDKPADA